MRTAHRWHHCLNHCLDLFLCTLIGCKVGQDDEHVGEDFECKGDAEEDEGQVLYVVLQAGPLPVTGLRPQDALGVENLTKVDRCRDQSWKRKRNIVSESEGMILEKRLYKSTGR